MSMASWVCFIINVGEIVLHCVFNTNYILSITSTPLGAAGFLTDLPSYRNGHLSCSYTQAFTKPQTESDFTPFNPFLALYFLNCLRERCLVVQITQKQQQIVPSTQQTLGIFRPRWVTVYLYLLPQGTVEFSRPKRQLFKSSTSATLFRTFQEFATSQFRTLCLPLAFSNRKRAREAKSGLFWSYKLPRLQPGWKGLNFAKPGQKRILLEGHLLRTLPVIRGQRLISVYGSFIPSATSCNSAF